MGLFNPFPTKPKAKRQESLQTPDAYWTLAAEQLIAALHTTNNGIEQAVADSRIKQYGPNVLKIQQQTTGFVLLLSQFKSPLVLILIFASIISAFVGEWSDASIVLAVVIGSTTLGFVQEYQASNAVEKLHSQVSIKSSALCNGKPQMLLSEQLVP